jgi:type VI secretion system secreted protein Hcp
MPIYLKFDSIDGEATAKGKEKWIEVLSFSWGVTNSSTITSGGGGGAGKASFQDLHFVQKTQASSPKLLSAAARGEHIKSALLTFLKGESAAAPAEYLKLKLEDVIISSYQTAGAEGSEGDVPTDQVSLNFAKIEFDYTPANGDGTPIVFAFDISQNR